MVLDHAVGVSHENNRHGDQGPRSGRVSQKVSSKSADQVVANNRIGTGPATTYVVAEYYIAVLE